MSRSLIIGIVVLAVVVGALFFFSGRATEQPTTRVEKVVTLENLQK